MKTEIFAQSESSFSHEIFSALLIVLCASCECLLSEPFTLKYIITVYIQLFEFDSVSINC